MRTMHKALSLIELLVVIAVVAILLAMIIIPTISATRRTAEITSCATNQRMIGAAILLYAVDNDGNVPGFHSGGSLSSTGTQNSLPRQLVPPRAEYLPDNTIFRCAQAMERIYYANEETGWVDWEIPTGGQQRNRSGYWHMYYSPNSALFPERGDEYGRNDNILLSEPYRAIMHCYYHPTENRLSSHSNGSVNVLKIDGSVQHYTTSEYNRARNHRSNFGWDRE